MWVRWRAGEFRDLNGAIELGRIERASDWATDHSMKTLNTIEVDKNSVGVVRYTKMTTGRDRDIESIERTMECYQLTRTKFYWLKRGGSVITGKILHPCDVIT